jgi:hypothetical protein
MASMLRSTRRLGEQEATGSQMLMMEMITIRIRMMRKVFTPRYRTL